MFPVIITSPFYRGRKRGSDSLKVTVVVEEQAVHVQVTTPWSLCHLNCKMRRLDRIFSRDLLVPIAIILLTGTLGLKE